jgi:large subunit ribosomal protein L3
MTSGFCHMPFIIGRKIEMTQQFTDDGTVVPVTLVRAEPNIVTQIRTEDRDGYTAVQLSTEPAKRLSKAQVGHLKDLPQMKTAREFRVSQTELGRGDQVDVGAFAPGNKVDVTGISKGRGFTGVVKRHGFKGGKATHGHKDQLRMPGSIASFPQGKIIKGKRMAGQFGNENITVKNLEVVSVDVDKNVIAIKGAIPGARGGLILVKTREGNTIWQT